MTLQDFQRLVKARPFRPFRIIMSSGEHYDIRHPEMVYLMRTKLLLGLDPDSQGIADDWQMCSLLHITAVESLEHGKPKRKKSA